MVTAESKYKIKRILCMPRVSSFIRCPARSRKKALKLEKEGDGSHLAVGHCCELCRCPRVAGFGTKGDFYGIGEDTGHYGVGFCHMHERAGRSGVALKYAENQMANLQQAGRAMTSRRTLKQCTDVAAPIAEKKFKLQQGFELVTGALKEFQDLCEAKRADLTEVDEKGNAVEDNTFMGLTETANGMIVPASDKTRFELALKISKSIGDLLKVHNVLEPEDMVHTHVVISALKLTMSAAARFMPNETDLNAFLEELGSIWSKMKELGV